MLRQPAQIRPIGNPSPKLLIRLPLPVNSLLLRHPPPLLRESVDARKEPVHERPAGLIVQLENLLELLLGGRRSRRCRDVAGSGPDVGQREGECVGVVDGQGPADRDAAAVGVGCVAEEGYVAVEDEGGEGRDGAHGVGLDVRGGLGHSSDDGVPVLAWR